MLLSNRPPDRLLISTCLMLKAHFGSAWWRFGDCGFLFTLCLHLQLSRGWRETLLCWLICNRSRKGFPLRPIVCLVSCLLAMSWRSARAEEWLEVVNHISSPCALPGGPAEGSFLPKQPKVLFPLIGHRSFGCHLRKSSNLSRETYPSRSEVCWVKARCRGGLWTQSCLLPACCGRKLEWELQVSCMSWLAEQQISVFVIFNEG